MVWLVVHLVREGAAADATGDAAAGDANGEGAG